MEIFFKGPADHFFDRVHALVNRSMTCMVIIKHLGRKCGVYISFVGYIAGTYNEFRQEIEGDQKVARRHTLIFK